MENKLKQYAIENKGFVVFCLLWIILHLILISMGKGESGLWPFGDDGFAMWDYGIVDFIFYLIVPIIIFFIWKLIGGDVHKRINDNN